MTLVGGPTIRRLEQHEWRAYRDQRLRALADAPDSFASTLEREAGRPDQEWTDRVKSAVASDSDLPLVVADGAALVGLAWGKIKPPPSGAAHVFQMWVAPEYRRQGYASQMLDRIIAWARRKGAHHLILSVTCGQEPAEHLYARAGFQPVGEPEPLRPEAVILSQRMSLSLENDDT